MNKEEELRTAQGAEGRGPGAEGMETGPVVPGTAGPLPPNGQPMNAGPLPLNAQPMNAGQIPQNGQPLNAGPLPPNGQPMNAGQPQMGYAPYPYPATAGYPYTPPAAPRVRKPQRPDYPLTKVDVLMAGLSVVLSVFGVAASFWGGFRFGYTISYALTFLIFAIYFRAERKKATPFAMLTGLLSFAMAGTFTLTSNVEIRLLSVFGMGIGGVLYLSSLSGSKRVAGDLGPLKTVAAAIGDTVTNSVRALRSLISSENSRTRTLSKVFLGLLISLPLLVVVVPLLMQADFAFEGLVRSLFSDLAVRLVQLLLGLLLTPLLLGFAYSSKYREEHVVGKKAHKGADPVLLSAILGALSVVYLLYLLAQFGYFFGEKPEGFSLSEYARRGFFELCAIAALNFVVLYTVVLISRKKEDGRLPGLVRGFGTFIGLFTLVITGTALAKMGLYIGGYGLTVLRVSTSVFMIFLAVVFVCLILRLYFAKVNVLRAVIVSALACLTVLGLGNVNRVVARYNVEGYYAGRLETLDVRYLGRLGDEGVVALADVATRESKAEDGKTEMDALWVLARGLRNYYDIDIDEADQAHVLGRTRTKFSQKSLPGADAYAAIEALPEAQYDGLLQIFVGISNDEWVYYEWWEQYDSSPADT